MKKLIPTLALLLNFLCLHAQNNEVDQIQIKEGLEEIITDISENYIYLPEKNIDLDCLRKHYGAEIPSLQNRADVVLFYENILNELYDNHVHLNTNTGSSFRLYSPLYARFHDGKPIVVNVWKTQIDQALENLIGAEVLAFNGTGFETMIEEFPTHCSDKESPEVREWIANKILAGRYNEPRMVTLKLKVDRTIQFDMDQIKLIEEEELLTSRVENKIGIIRINNSLGNNHLIAEFDKALDELKNTKGLIIDLRNTIGGGNSYVARGIMSRFIEEELPYQRHVSMDESWDDQPKVGRSWVEYVSPRSKPYDKPVVILVGRWTGSMGEGLAVGFEGMKRGEVVGSEMARLAGAIFGFGLNNHSFGYQLSKEKLFHLNGTPRELYIPTHYVGQTTSEKDETLEKGMELIKTLMN